MRTAVMLGVFAALCGHCLGAESQPPQTLNDLADCRALADQIMAEVAKGRTKETLLSAETVWCGNTMAKMRFVAAKCARMEEGYQSNYGPFTKEPVEYLGRLTRSKDHCAFGYFIKRQRSPVPWLFHFYRPGQQWRLADVKVGADAIPDIKQFDQPFPAAEAARLSEVATHATASREDAVQRLRWPERIGDRETCKQIADRLMADVSRGKAEEVFLSVFEEYGHRRPLYPPGRSVSEIQTLVRKSLSADWKAQLELGSAVPDGFEYCGRLETGACVSTFVYVTMRERGPCEWIVTFYRPDNEWRPHDIRGFAEGMPAVQPFARITFPGPKLGAGGRDAMHDEAAAPHPVSSGSTARTQAALADRAACRAVADQIMAEVASERVEEGLLSAERYWCGTELNALKYVAALQTREVELARRAVGPIVADSLEYLGRLDQGDSVIMFGYMVKRQIGPVYWFLHFYRLGNEWKLGKIDSSEKAEPLAVSFTRSVPASAVQTPAPQHSIQDEPSEDASWPKRIEDKETCKEIADRLIADISRGKAEEAFFFVLEEYEHRHPLYPPGRPISTIQRLAQKCAQGDRNAKSAFGPTIPGRFEYVGRYDVADCFTKLVYYAKHEGGPCEWRFLFYKPEGEWTFGGAWGYFDGLATIQGFKQVTPASREPQRPENSLRASDSPFR